MFQLRVKPSKVWFYIVSSRDRGWSGGAMVLGKLPVPGRPTIWIIVGQGPTALTVGAGGGCLDIFTLIYPFSPLSTSLWKTARYRLKYCLKGPVNPKQPTNQPLGTKEQVLDRKILSFFSNPNHAAGLFWTLGHLSVQTLPPGNASFQNSSI